MQLKNKDLEKKFKDLQDQIKSYMRNPDMNTLKAAFDFAKVAHAGEKRISGADVMFHPLETALILASWKMDIATIISGLLHDTVDHGAAIKKDITDNFGEEVAGLVEGVTKVSKVKLKGSKDEVFVENLRKMFLAIAKDLRVVFLRLAERLNNLKTLKYLPDVRRKAYAIDSLELYAPLAERLGMWKVRTQIDDLAFEYAYPEDYKKVLMKSNIYYKNAEKRIEAMIRKIKHELEKENIEPVLYGRKKGLYSLFNKLKRKEIDWDFGKIHDIIALRIILDKVSDCYIALGNVHKIYKPVPHLALTDFIAMPKPNGYRSIHTKVYGPDGKIVEVQIRTKKMHTEAEFGAAAHWQLSALKSSGKVGSQDIDEGKWSVDNDKLSWVKQLVEWQKEMSDSKEFLKAVKFDALSRRIFIFSPKGDVFDLPVDATPIDFAYAVHTDLGEYIKGAIVDGKIVPLSHKLQNGQVVEILKYKEKKTPNSDWLSYVVTTNARREIKKSIRRTEKK